MKKTLPYLLLFMFALLIWNGLTDHGGFQVHFDDGDMDGAGGALLGTLLAGGGILIGAIMMIIVAVVLALVFAGMGVLAVCALALAVVAALIAISPLLLPILIPCLIVWFMARRRPASPAPKEHAA